MKRILFVILLLSIFPIVSHSAIIFQDNFDACSTNCSPTLGSITPPSPSPWSQWLIAEVDATYGGVTHKSGEITSPGHGGTGKSLKMWRVAGHFGSYDGALQKTGGLSGGITHWFVSYWQKISPGFHYTGPDGSGFKMWRFKTTGQETGAHHEIYLNSYPYSN
jgi:hypothetical protein